MSLPFSNTARAWRGEEVEKQKQGRKGGQGRDRAGFSPGLGTRLLLFSLLSCGIIQVAADTGQCTSTKKLLEEKISAGHFWTPVLDVGGEVLAVRAAGASVRRGQGRPVLDTAGSSRLQWPPPQGHPSATMVVPLRKGLLKRGKTLPGRMGRGGEGK